MLVVTVSQRVQITTTTGQVWLQRQPKFPISSTVIHTMLTPSQNGYKSKTTKTSVFSAPGGVRITTIYRQSNVEFCPR